MLGLFITDSLLAAASLGIAFYYCWQLTLVLLATVPVSLIVLGLVGRGFEFSIEAQKRELSYASKCVTAAVTAIDLVKVYNGFDNEVWQYMRTTKDAGRWFLEQAWVQAIQIGYVKLWMTSLFVVGFWFAVYLVDQGSTTAGNALTTFYAALTTLQVVEGFTPQWIVLAKGISSGNFLQKIVRDAAQHRERGTNIPYRPQTCTGDLQLKNVSFAYPYDPNKTVLNRSSFFFPAGEMTFIVGRSGSGKSTLSKIILNLYEPLTGHVLFDGRPVQTLDNTWLRSNITVIDQSTDILNDTFFMNVAVGSLDPGNTTREEVRLACDEAMLQSTLSSLPSGVDTVLGHGGYDLSGGQRQRLALARARLRDPPVLILDEVTSGLDPTSRVLIMEAIRKWRKGKTTIIITHDISQIQKHEYVYVMDKGCLVQEGFRKDLDKDDSGVFASLLAFADGTASSFTTSLDHVACESPKMPSPEPFVQKLSCPISRLSQVVPQHGDIGTFRTSGPLGVRLGEGTYRSTIMRTKEAWDTRAASRNRETGENSNSYDGPDKTARRSSLDIAEQREEMTRTHHSFATMPEATSNGQQPSSGQLGQPPDAFSTNAEPAANSKSGIRIPVYKILSTTWPVLSRSDHIRAVLGLLACLLTAACNPTFSYVFAQLLAVFWAPSSEMIAKGQAWVIRLAAIAVVDGVSLFIACYLMQRVGQAWVTSLRVEAFKRILSQPRQFFDKAQNSPSQIVETLDRSAEEMRNLVGQLVPTVVIGSTMVLGALIWALTISWRLTLVALAPAPIIYSSTFLSASVSTKWEAETNAAAEKLSLVTAETFLNIRMVRALTLETFFSSKYSSSVDEAFRVGVKRGLWTGMFFGLNQGISWWLTALVFWYATVLLTSLGTTVSVTDILQVINLLLFSMGTAIAMFNNMPQLGQAKAAAIQILYYATLRYRNSHEGRGERRVMTPFPIEMRGLQFAYPRANNTTLGDTGSKVLKSVNLWVDQGDCVAIVGSSGCGKSSIAHLLLRLYEPLARGTTEDRPGYDDWFDRPHNVRPNYLRVPPLSYGYIPADELSTPVLRTHMASVPQHPFMFPTTIRENILYGLHPDSPYRNGNNSVIEAAKAACIHEFIVTLEEGYSTVVGEGGLGLSGGQMQRISIARALVRRPKLLVMDEPTSALDADCAEGVRAAIRKITKQSHQTTGDNMAAVIVTHSREMMKMAERIVLLDQGMVVAEGGYDELLARSGKFAELLGGGSDWESTGV